MRAKVRLVTEVEVELDPNKYPESVKTADEMLEHERQLALYTTDYFRHKSGVEKRAEAEVHPHDRVNY